MLSRSYLDSQWQKHLITALNSNSFKQLDQFVQGEREKGKIIFPSQENIFHAFNLTPLRSVRVVILGQDPYHQPGQAHGLAFSVNSRTKIPPSLRNIFKEIELSTGKKAHAETAHAGDLTYWAGQGVLLMNTVLTVEHGRPGSHAGKGWEALTDAAIVTVSDTQDCVIFMLWGAYARKKKSLVDTSKHIVLEASHPSPFSAHRGFFGCNHFSLVQAHLKNQIDW